GIALLLDLRRPLPEKRLGSFRAVASGAALALLPIATWLTVERAWLPAWEWCFRWARDHQRGYPGFSFWRYFGPALTAEPLFFSLAVFGALGALVRWRDHGLLVAAWLLSFGSFALQRAPYPYSLLPFMGVSAALAARGAQAIWETFAPRPSLKRGAALTLALVLGLQHWRLLQLPGNAEQRKVQARIGELTRVTDAAYDNSGGYVTRPHAHFFFYTDAYLRTHWAQTLEDDVPRALLESECVLRVQDVRSDTLPPKLVQFLSENYQPVDGDLSLWGRRLSVTADGTFEGQFYAVKSDRYFVQPAEAQGGLRIDGLRVGPVFTLTRGWHSVRYRGSASELFLLWLPRNQERWMPTYGRAPHYSRLF
ncbi:MAG TPA: hypothetical protein VEY30_13615, partial [Myxococcaceae bacterium]|nr:hypothetical protein [Myxococcaceae bacterium]